MPSRPEFPPGIDDPVPPRVPARVSVVVGTHDPDPPETVGDLAKWVIHDILSGVVLAAVGILVGVGVGLTIGWAIWGAA